MYNIILFDLDGTLTDPKLGITSCVRYALESFGIHEKDSEKLTTFIGPPLKDSFMQIYGMSGDEADRAVEKYRERFSVTGMYENEIFSGTVHLLESLAKKGKRLILATSKPFVYAKEILRYFDILKYFDEVFGPDFTELHISKGEIIRRAINMCGTENRANIIMVGDREMDIFGAKDNDIKSVGVRFGYAKKNELESAGADYIAETMDELEELLLNI